MHRSFLQATSISDLGSPAFLTSLLGEVRAVEREAMTTVGFSGTEFERIQVQLEEGGLRTLVLKHIHPERDVTARRTGGIAREARLLADRSLDDVWRTFEPAYLAYAFDVDASAVLMDDLSAHLFPDVREPITRADEDAIIDALAALHAGFWNREARTTRWLAKGEFMYSFLTPYAIEQDESLGHTHRLYAAAKEGWTLAHQQLPRSVSTLLALPPGDLTQMTDGLPRTIIHGDPKVANFAILPNGRVSAFDWAMMADGCATFDLGWYVAVSASRLTRSKDDVFAAYRATLERHLGQSLDDALWTRMYDAAVLAGAAVLLWNKALNMKNRLPGAIAEWHWWVNALEGVASRMPRAAAPDCRFSAPGARDAVTQPRS